MQTDQMPVKGGMNAATLSLSSSRLKNRLPGQPSVSVKKCASSISFQVFTGPASECHSCKICVLDRFQKTHAHQTTRGLTRDSALPYMAVASQHSTAWRSTMH